MLALKPTNGLNKQILTKKYRINLIEKPLKRKYNSLKRKNSKNKKSRSSMGLNKLKLQMKN